MMRISFPLTTFILLLSAGLSTAQTPVTTCGQVVSGDAVLAHDLDCSTYPSGPAVQVTSGTLRLNGHSLIGNEFLDLESEFVEYWAHQSTLWCSGACEVVGPGTIVGATDAAIWVSAPAVIRNVSVVGGANPDSHARGISMLATPPRKLTVLGATVTGHGSTGISGGRQNIRDSTVSGNGRTGLSSSFPIRVRNSAVRDNGKRPGQHKEWSGIFGTNINIRDSIVSDNPEHGIRASRSIKAKRCTIERNGETGVTAARSATIRSSHFADNAIADIEVCEGRLKVRDTVCEISSDCDDGSRRICSLD